MNAREIATAVQRLTENIERAFIGKPETVRKFPQNFLFSGNCIEIRVRIW